MQAFKNSVTIQKPAEVLRLTAGVRSLLSGS
jgi:hypothetical protein